MFEFSLVFLNIVIYFTAIKAVLIGSDFNLSKSFNKKYRNWYFNKRQTYKEFLNEE